MSKSGRDDTIVVVLKGIFLFIAFLVVVQELARGDGAGALIWGIAAAFAIKSLIGRRSAPAAKTDEAMPNNVLEKKPVEARPTTEQLAAYHEQKRILEEKRDKGWHERGVACKEAEKRGERVCWDCRTINSNLCSSCGRCIICKGCDGAPDCCSSCG